MTKDRIDRLIEKLPTYKCPACGHTAKSPIEIWHVHSNGHNGHAFKMVKVE